MPLWDFSFEVYRYDEVKCTYDGYETNRCLHEAALAFATDGSEGVFITTPQDTDYVDVLLDEKNKFETTTGLNIIAKDPAKYKWTFRFDNPVPMNSLLEI